MRKATTQPEAESDEKIQELYEAFLAKLGSKDRTNVERHVAALEETFGPEHAKMWRRLAGTLFRLAGHAVQTSGQRAVRYYVADGKYRMQAFALEDPRDHTLAIYATDALDRAKKSGLLGAPVNADAEDDGAKLYGIAGERGAALRIEAITDANSETPEYYRHMLGWNRKAMKITLPSTASLAQIRAAEALCALALPPGAAG
jgi:hypothetical protein